jgi:hypothetical protein
VSSSVSGTARVAQSVDAGALKALARKGLWVRTPPRAPRQFVWQDDAPPIERNLR